MQFSIQEQLLRRNMKRFRGGLTFKAHRLVYHPTLGSESNKEEKKSDLEEVALVAQEAAHPPETCPALRL